jgi:hypothetical protein
MSGHFMKCFWIDRQCCFSCRISGYIAWNSSYLLVSGFRSPYSEIWSFIFQVFSLTIQNLLNFGTCIILSDEYLLIWNSWVHPLMLPTYKDKLVFIFFFFHPLSTPETEMGIFKQNLQGNLEFEPEPWNHLASCHLKILLYWSK